jgi:hypothetical protein
MIKRFNAVSLDGVISKIKVQPENLDNAIKDHFAHDDGMDTYVELNEANIANARIVFDETIARMNCKPLTSAADSGGRINPKRRRTRRTRKTRRTRGTRRTRRIS